MDELDEQVRCAMLCCAVQRWSYWGALSCLLWPRRAVCQAMPSCDSSAPHALSCDPLFALDVLLDAQAASRLLAPLWHIPLTSTLPTPSYPGPAARRSGLPVDCLRLALPPAGYILAAPGQAGAAALPPAGSQQQHNRGGAPAAPCAGRGGAPLLWPAAQQQRRQRSRPGRGSQPQQPRWQQRRGLEQEQRRRRQRASRVIAAAGCRARCQHARLPPALQRHQPVPPGGASAGSTVSPGGAPRAAAAVPSQRL